MLMKAAPTMTKLHLMKHGESHLKLKQKLQRKPQRNNSVSSTNKLPQQNNNVSSKNKLPLMRRDNVKKKHTKKLLDNFRQHRTLSASVRRKKQLLLPRQSESAKKKKLPLLLLKLNASD
jgi:hypothetical protein